LSQPTTRTSVVQPTMVKEMDYADPTAARQTDPTPPGRDNNRLQRRLKAARLPLPATIEDLDLSPSRGIDRRLVLQLAQGHRPPSRSPTGPG
jgi:hypothetical protein